MGRTALSAAGSDEALGGHDSTGVGTANAIGGWYSQYLGGASKGMINFNDVNRDHLWSSNRWPGKVARLPLKLIPKKAVLPILQGPGRGLKWIVGSYNHGCWLGSYEYEKQRIIADLVKPGDVVYDLGAHVGYFSIIFARLVGEQGAVYAFEPFADNYSYLCQHVSLNGISNLHAFKVGIGPASGVASFEAGPDMATGRKAVSGKLQFPVFELTEFVRTRQLRVPSLIKIDIEGEEAHVIPVILDYVIANKIKLMISTHSDAITEQLVRLLSEKRFHVTPLQWANRPQRRLATNATLLIAAL